MKQTLLLSVLGMSLLTACSTAFKTGQTPDDVYYSPGREVASVKEDENQKKQSEEYQQYVSNIDDQYLRMKIANRYRWGSLDDFDYWYDSRYDFGMNNYYNAINPYAYWTPGWSLSFGYYGYERYGYGGWGWRNPVSTIVYYSNPKYAGGGYTSGSNITAYRNKNYSNTNIGYKDPKTGNFVPSGNNNNFGNLLKRVFTGSSGNTASYDRPVRSFTPGTTSTPSAPPPSSGSSSSAGGNSGGFKSTGTTTNTGRGGKG